MKPHRSILQNPRQAVQDAAASSEGNVSTQGHSWPTPIFLSVTSFSAGTVIHWKKQHKDTICQPAAQKSVSMTTSVSKVPINVCHGSYHKVSYHWFFPPPSHPRQMTFSCLQLSSLAPLLPPSFFSGLASSPLLLLLLLPSL